MNSLPLDDLDDAGRQPIEHGAMKRSNASRIALFVAAALCALCVSCGETRPPTATPDYAALETRVAYRLQATLTAKAPPTATFTPTAPPTATSTPTPFLSPTATPVPTPTSLGPMLALVRATQGEATNIVALHLASAREDVLTHFVEPMNMSDLSWSKDGQWLLFISAHDFIHSRNNERNVYLMQADGSQQRMLTGDYVDPARAPGPYTTVSGRIVGGEGDCLVCAQGTVNPAHAAADGSFELRGVPQSAQWLRALCLAGGITLQGDIELTPHVANTSVSITVNPQGQGWGQASLSRDGRTIVGTYYSWTLDQEGKRKHQTEGVLFDREGGLLGKLELPPDTALGGVDWSPIEDKIVGALSSEKGAYLWLWDGQGHALGQLLELPNPEREILTPSDPVWSPDGSQIAFALRRWDWWGDQQVKTDVMVVSATGQDVRTLVDSEWGHDASHPSWATDGASLYYQLSVAQNAEQGGLTTGDIWHIALVEQATPVPVLRDGNAMLPAARPLDHPPR
jgi:hypothetical protein